MQERILGNTLPDKQKEEEPKRAFEGMSPELKQEIEAGKVLSFDSTFECGNLDRAVMVSEKEYDLYMRPDTNTRGHHQWFYFKTSYKKKMGTIQFNIINFTKHRSLYEMGMKVCYCSLKEKKKIIEFQQSKNDGPVDEDIAGWKRGGKNIKYCSSKLNKLLERNASEFGASGSYFNLRKPQFYQVSFQMDFNDPDGDEVLISYNFPYTFTRLSRFLR